MEFVVFGMPEYSLSVTLRAALLMSFMPSTALFIPSFTGTVDTITCLLKLFSIYLRSPKGTLLLIDVKYICKYCSYKGEGRTLFIVTCPIPKEMLGLLVA